MCAKGEDVLLYPHYVACHQIEEIPCFLTSEVEFPLWNASMFTFCGLDFLFFFFPFLKGGSHIKSVQLPAFNIEILFFCGILHLSVVDMPPGIKA